MSSRGSQGPKKNAVYLIQPVSKRKKRCQCSKVLHSETHSDVWNVKVKQETCFFLKVTLKGLNAAAAWVFFFSFFAFILKKSEGE